MTPVHGKSREAKMRRGLRWSLAGVIGVIGVVSVLVIPAFGDGPVTAEVGTLRLHLNNDVLLDRFTFEPAPGSDDIPDQILTQTNCRLDLPANPLLVKLGAVPPVPAPSNPNKLPYPGLKDHRIGVGQSGEGNGEPCARINQSLSQSLTLSLSGELTGKAIVYAEIDLGFKFNGNAVLQLKKGGPSGTDVGTVTVPCNGQSDCGPDSGGDDNLRVILDPETDSRISGPFDTIIISSGTSGGAISLEGGLGGTGDSLFTIVDVFDGEIPCEGSKTLGGGADATFEITRGFDAVRDPDDLEDPCKGPDAGLLYSFDAGVLNGQKFVDFVTEDVDGDAVAQFLETITWTFDSPPVSPQFLALEYDDHVGAGIRVMPWCKKDPRVGGVLPAPVDTTTILPTGHTSCLIESTSGVRLVGLTWKFVSEDTVYNIGDGFRAK
jgi:hypothetical protein